MKKSEFLNLLEALEPKLFGFAYRMLRDEEKVKDAMQELMLRLWKKRKELNKNRNISAYAFRTLNNICVDVIRHHNRYISESHSISNENALSFPRTREQNSTPLSISQDHKELIQRIRQAVSNLPDKQRTIIELHDFQEFNHLEIADMLDMEPNTVRTNLSRARAKIQAQFKKEEIYG